MFICTNQKIPILPDQSDYFYLPCYISDKSHVDNGHWRNDMNHLQGAECGCGCACVCK